MRFGGILLRLGLEEDALHQASLRFGSDVFERKLDSDVLTAELWIGLCAAYEKLNQWGIYLKRRNLNVCDRTMLRSGTQLIRISESDKKKYYTTENAPLPWTMDLYHWALQRSLGHYS